MSEPDNSTAIPFRERLIGAALVAPIRAARLLPYRWRVPVAGWLTSRVLAPLAGYGRRVRENLAFARPDLPEAEVRRLMRRVTDNAGRNMMELYSPEFGAVGRAAPVTGPGLPILRAARDAGKPVIFVTGHFGSFNAARLAMIEQGFDMGVFYRPMANRPFNAHYVAAMAAISKPMFEQGRRGMMQMVKHLRSGGVLAILNDLNAHDGVPLDFFGKPALTSLATAEMALKFDAPLLPVWGRRAEDGIHFVILVEEPIAHSDPVTMTQEFNDRLEAQVRAHMDQWFWIHRRWKDGTGPLAEKGAAYLRSLEEKT
ncbi:lysophospholipid acyltransferase family protein [Roseovarius aestuariivivens]|uniref:lysophospholipid acyltransferase family protein n=1 Tax=Roseovarius aestuariivivens TaxID=1888910 RepID=UPI0010815632|nr:lysophospholipid acyltransferase family protein [Roseovarius aestuariivivens]